MKSNVFQSLSLALNRVILTQWVFSVGIWSLMILKIYSSFFPLVLHARKQCLNVNEEQPISVDWGPNSLLSPLGMENWIWPSMDRYRMYCVETCTLLPSSMYRKPTEHGRCCMQINQLLTKNYVELEDNSSAPVIYIYISEQSNLVL